MSYVDTKITIWQRAYFDDDSDMEKIAKMIEEGDDYYDEDLGFLEVEDLYDTVEDLTIEDNLGEPTIEVYSEENMIWNNRDKFEIK